MKHKIPLLSIVIALVCVIGYGILMPYMSAYSKMPEDATLTIRQQADRGFLFSWTEADHSDSYLLEILNPEVPDNQNILYSNIVNSSTDSIFHSFAQSDVLVRVTSVVDFSVFGILYSRAGENPLEVSVCMEAPEILDLQWVSDADTDIVSVNFQMDGADSCCVYQIYENGNCTLLRTLSEESCNITFGNDGLLPIPESDEPIHLGFAGCREEPGFVFEGSISAQIEIDRQDFLGTDLNVQFSRDDSNRLTLTWDETKGEYYEVQRLNPMGDWETICQVNQGEALSYTTDILAKFREYRYRVAAVGGQQMENSDYAAVSDVVSFFSRESSIYATVWPVMDMDAYFNARRSKVTARVEAGKAYCVIDERNGMFGVRVGEQVCYIDSNYCMINLPEYMGDLCSYQIANSKNSQYMVHEFEIPDVTGVVTPGYESICQSDGSYLVPLLYPTARKLVAAAQNAMAKGYKLKIYDSFRPQLATRDIYSRTSGILNHTIPEKTYTGVPVSTLQLPVTGEDGTLSYRDVMTNNKYALNSFLAKGTSRHNLGVALDLTLEDLSTGEELRMQTSMHDLSWYSVTGFNNAEAKLLASIMKEAGFATLFTEWWHFQDDESNDALTLPAVWYGISAEGWTCDDNGWKYRNPQGVFFRDQTLLIGDREYLFDENGYAVGGEIAFG